MLSRKDRNYIQLQTGIEGNFQKLELVKDILKNGTFLPKPLLQKDIDESFKKWCEDELKIISDEGILFPTMTLFSNQRFSEYSQTWRYVDENKNLILNFKTITRDNNPKGGTIQGHAWNIPGERWYQMKKQLALDDNGTEYILALKMRQPIALDLDYKLSIFTTKYEKINEFNLLINEKFSQRQCYIWPNNHPIPMIIDSISDESSYQIDDRQFYAQTFKIKTMAYLIPEDYYKVEEIPLKVSVNFGNMPDLKKAKADVEIEENDTNVILSVYFPYKCKMAKFTNDCDFTIDTKQNGSITYTNMFNTYKIFINDEEIDTNTDKIVFKDKDEVKILINKLRENNIASMIINATK